MPGTVLGTSNSALKRTDKIPVLVNFISQAGKDLETLFPPLSSCLSRTRVIST